MKRIPVIAVFDVGKTNKKLFLFDEQYTIVFERTARFTEICDEDGSPCENLESLELSIYDSLQEVLRNEAFELKAVNFASYGASLVYLDENGKSLTPLYNYLKEYPEDLKQQFYADYGGEEEFSNRTASPVLGSLNSGMQFYRLKHHQPELFKKIRYILHLPQYLSYLMSGEKYAELTSIGCHTNLWDFTTGDYHYWVKQEGVLKLMPPIVSSGSVRPVKTPGQRYVVGAGLHDSSAALVPYLFSFNEPFVLLSTGTWCISFNPYNSMPLTREELANDCLCYMQYQGKAVKASRLFAGYEHENQLKRITAYFNTHASDYRHAAYIPGLLSVSFEGIQDIKSGKFSFAEKDLAGYANDMEAYHHLMLDLVQQQYIATQRVISGTKVKRIFVDGGFSKNTIFMNLLAEFFPDLEVFAAHMAQATAIGAALVIHQFWNTKPLPNDIIGLKYYAALKKA